jgi:hypothetical protein
MAKPTTEGGWQVTPNPVGVDGGGLRWRRWRSAEASDGSNV